MSETGAIEPKVSYSVPDLEEHPILLGTIVKRTDPDNAESYPRVSNPNIASVL